MKHKKTVSIIQYKKPIGATRLLVLSDMHCGSVYGLTPPKWQTDPILAPVQSMLWKWYLSEIKALGEVDKVIINGDSIDGKGKRSGGRGLITVDRNEQTDMAVDCIWEINTKIKNIYIIEGTPYHTGDEEPWEKVIADKLGCAYKECLELVCNKKVFNFKHYVGSSSVPHTRSVAVTRARMWNIIGSVKAGITHASYVVRSHVHYYINSSDSISTGINTPCLQIGSEFGNLRCEGISDVGFIWFDIEKNGNTTCRVNLCNNFPLPVERIEI